MKLNTYSSIAALTLTALLAGMACQGSYESDLGSDQTGGLGGTDASSGGQGELGGGGGLGSGATSDPLFAVMYQIYDDSSSTSYLSLLDTLDMDEIDVSKAREYGEGRAFVQTYGGKLFVGDAMTPTVTRYSVDDADQLVLEDTISFANFGLTSSQFDSWNVTFISPDKAYLVDFREGTTIIWNPSSMEITGEIPPADEFLREGWTLEGSPAVVRDGLLFRTFDWANYDENTYVPSYLLAVYDIESDEIVEVSEETRCPVPGNLVHVDEQENIYFSNWVWPVEGAILRDAPEPCVLRVNAGETAFDDDWRLRYQDVTADHHGAMFTYLGDGQALVAAFYDENTSFDETTAPWTYVGSMNWRIWNVDLDQRTGAPLEGIDFNGGAFTPAWLDDRFYLMVPGGYEENYATQIYEVVSGRAERRVALPGWSYQIVQVR
jgi:hypothetical protein